MAEPPPFRPDQARDAIEGEGDFLLPVCMPKPDLLMGEALAVIVLTTVEGQRIGLLPVSRTPCLGVKVKPEVLHAATQVRA